MSVHTLIDQSLAEVQASQQLVILSQKVRRNHFIHTKLQLKVRRWQHQATMAYSHHDTHCDNSLPEEEGRARRPHCRLCSETYIWRRGIL